MERVFSGKVYEVVAQPDGIVFAYCKSAEDDMALVAYKMISLETGILSDVTKNIYQLSKFGSNYRSATQFCVNYVTARSIVMPNGRAFFCTEDGGAFLLDGDGLPIWTGELKYRGEKPSDIALYKNAIWACYKKAGVMIRFNINTMREEIRIGGANSPFDAPIGIFIDGDTAVISNEGSNKLVKVDLNSYTVSDYKEFTESVYGYVRVKKYEFILLESGIYVL